MARASTFTSYINVEPDRAIDAKFATLERKATSSFQRIAQQAARANAGMSAGISGFGGGMNAAQTAQMRQQANALREVARENQRVATAAGATNRQLNQTTRAAAGAKREVTGLERSLRTTATTLNVVQGPLGPIAGRVGALASAVGELTGLRLGLAGVGAGLFFIASQANKYTEVRSRLIPLYESQQDVNRAMRDTVRIAEAARTSLAPVVDLYAKLTLAGRDVGLDQRQASRLTEIAAKAAKLSGGAQISQDAGLYQFAQGVGSGALAGDELKSIRENTLRLAKAIADGMGVPIAKLKELGKEGKLTPKVIADALEKESKRIDEELSRLPETLASATSKFQNSLMTMVGESDQAFGFTTALAEGLAFLARNLQLATDAALGLGVAFASYKAGTALSAISARTAETSRLRNETQLAARAEVTAASDARKAAASRITSLRSVRAEIRQNINVERQQRAAALATAREAQQNARRSGMGFLNPTASREYARAMEQARAANVALTNSQQRLQLVNGQLSASTATMTTQTTRYRAAMATAGSGAVSFATRLRGVIASLNPLGIVLSVGISLLISWAFQQDAAAAAADRMAKREDYLAGVIDFTTGKILVQNQALRENAKLKVWQGLLEAQKDWRAARGDLTPAPQSGSSIARFGYLPQGGNQRANAVLGQLQTGDINIATARKKLLDMGAGASSFEKLDAFENATTGFLKQNLSYKIMSGNATDRDYEVAGMTPPSKQERPGAPAGGVEKAAGGRKKLKDASDAAAKAEAELQKALDRTDKREDILARYDAEPKALDRAARDARELRQLVGETMNGIAAITKENPLGQGIYTQEMADADAERINYGVRQPIRDLLRDQERQLQISGMMLAGYEDEAAALEKALSLQDSIGEVTREEYETLLANERQQKRINDALASRQRITGMILGLADQTRDSFEDMLINIPKKGFSAVKDFGAQIFENIARIQVRKITETLFAGADERLRKLISGQGGVDVAVDMLEKNATRASSGTEKLASATERAAARIEAATSGMVGAGGVPTTAAGQIKASADAALRTAKSAGKSVGIGSAATGVLGAITGSAGLGKIFAGGGGANDNGDESYDPNAPIVVTAPRRVPAPQSGKLPTGAQAYDTMFEGFGDALDKTFKTDGFFKKIGGSVGKAFQGAGTGMMASSFAKALGLKQSTTGAAIGGAIGSFLPIPGGSIIGGLVGGTIGGLFKKTKKASATIGMVDGELGVSSLTGNSGSYKNNANSLAGGVIEQLNSIADALGADLGGSLGVSIGQRKKKFVVDPTGQGRTKGGGTVKFDTEEDAIAYAVRNALQDGVVRGISAASQRILASGKDLQKQLQKAVLIESIPKRLMAITDPVRFAVTELNEEFAQMLAALKEGGATAKQYAEMAALYELERGKAIEAATQQASSAITAFLDEMMGGSSSPLNKRTVYQNASDKLNTFKSDIASGKVVDQNALLNAAQNFQEASRNLFGSGADFFADFNSLKDLLTKARDNAGGAGNVTNLPGSPFANDTTVQNAIASLAGATNSQTGTLNGTLQQILAALKAQNDNGNTAKPPAAGTGSTGGSSLGYLPGVIRGGGGGGRIGKNPLQ